MKDLSFIQMHIKEKIIPLKLVTIGSNNQPYINRPVGLPYHQIFLTMEGKGVFRLFGAGDIELAPHDAIIIPSGTSHEYFPSSKKAWHLGFAGFEGELANSLLAQLNFKEMKKMSIHPFSVVWSTFEELWATAKTKENDSQWKTSQYLYSFLLELKKLSEVEDGLQNSQYTNEHVEKVAKFIRINYAKPLKIQSLSEMAGYSPQHFIRVFRKMYGMTPNQYLENIRLEKAKYLLEEEEDLRILEVAHQVGIEVNYFIRTFKQKYGVTPGEYRTQFSNSKS